jgi:hypothetical protein
MNKNLEVILRLEEINRRLAELSATRSVLEDMALKLDCLRKLSGRKLTGQSSLSSQESHNFLSYRRIRKIGLGGRAMRRPRSPSFNFGLDVHVGSETAKHRRHQSRKQPSKILGRHCPHCRWVVSSYPVCNLASFTCRPRPGRPAISRLDHRTTAKMLRSQINNQFN